MQDLQEELRETEAVVESLRGQLLQTKVEANQRITAGNVNLQAARNEISESSKKVASQATKLKELQTNSIKLSLIGRQ